ncbi:unnamed protein product [Urochloa decumbens]|uniref:SET domain-containing protein n=1 Tax=Urochloa decumbens TaxID=240449 RepID=A0ABC9CKG7_9POAL
MITEKPSWIRHEGLQIFSIDIQPGSLRFATGGGDQKKADFTNSIEEVFCRLPLPYVNEDINIDSTITDFVAAIYKPPPYMFISRIDSACQEGCECRALLMSCSKNCCCSDLCTNRPFLKDKKITTVKTKQGGRGVIALEPLEKGDFVIEYVGEVIDDATYEKRIWDLRKRGEKNFYMCEISKDFTIDVTLKGNQSRFLNHSCEPNCELENWQVDGETRVGVFASRSIKAAEPLTYDFRTLRRHKDKSPSSFHPLDLICEAIGRCPQDVGARAQDVASVGEEQNNVNSLQSSENNMQKMVDLGGQVNDVDQQAQRSDEHVTKRPLTTSNRGIFKKHKAIAEMPCIEEIGSVHPESRMAQANVNKQEATQGKDYSISRCLDVLEAMDDVPDEMKILASDVFRDATNREMFLCYAPRLRGPWLKKELGRLHVSHRVN